MVSIWCVIRKLLKILILVISIDSVFSIMISYDFELICSSVLMMMIEEMVLVIVISGVCSEWLIF